MSDTCEICTGAHATSYHLPQAIQEQQRQPSKIRPARIGWQKRRVPPVKT